MLSTEKGTEDKLNLRRSAPLYLPNTLNEHMRKRARLGIANLPMNPKIVKTNEKALRHRNPIEVPVDVQNTTSVKPIGSLMKMKTVSWKLDTTSHSQLIPNKMSLKPKEALNAEWELDVASHAQLKPEKIKEVVDRARSKADAIIGKEEIVMCDGIKTPNTVDVKMFKE